MNEKVTQPQDERSPMHWPHNFLVGWSMWKIPALELGGLDLNTSRASIDYRGWYFYNISQILLLPCLGSSFSSPYPQNKKSQQGLLLPYLISASALSLTSDIVFSRSPLSHFYFRYYVCANYWHSRHITTSILWNALPSSRSVLPQGLLIAQALPSFRSSLNVTFLEHLPPLTSIRWLHPSTHFLWLMFLHNTFHQLTYGGCACV